jgi:2-polyprenyl-3-methyl-5-hydroxy-6-metoxy-1,4-benzoquinol methylase
MNSGLKEVNFGWRAILVKSVFYQFIQTVFGGDRSREYLYKRYVEPIGTSAHVLDIGCGPGHMAGFMPDSIKYTGYDISENYIDTAKETYIRKNNINFICSTTSELINDDLVPDNSIDIITIHGVIHHVSDDVAKQFFMLSRQKLKVGGIMVILEPVWLTGRSSFRRFVMGMDRGKNIKSTSEWERFFKVVTNDWASSIYHIEENIVRLYYLIICEITKQND